MKRWIITFEQNGGEYTGWLEILCNKIELDEQDDCVLYADGMRIQIDEKIIEVEEMAMYNKLDI